jgi:hypothetical protein
MGAQAASMCSRMGSSCSSCRKRTGHVLTTLFGFVGLGGAVVDARPLIK